MPGLVLAPMHWRREDVHGNLCVRDVGVPAPHKAYVTPLADDGFSWHRKAQRRFPGSEVPMADVAAL